jgi:hypothetical protein
VRQSTRFDFVINLNIAKTLRPRRAADHTHHRRRGDRIKEPQLLHCICLLLAPTARSPRRSGATAIRGEPDLPVTIEVLDDRQMQIELKPLPKELMVWD